MVTSRACFFLSCLFSWSFSIYYPRRLTIRGWTLSAASIMASRQWLITGRYFLSLSTNKRMPSHILSMRLSSMSWIRYKHRNTTLPDLHLSQNNRGYVTFVLSYLVYNGNKGVVMLVLVKVKLA